MRKPSDSIKLVWPPLLLVLCFWGASIYGLNFGAHWDENRAKFDAVQNTLKTGIFLQASDFADEGGHYNHGGLNYLLTWSGLTPEIARFLITGPRTREELSRVI